MKPNELLHAWLQTPGRALLLATHLGVSRQAVWRWAKTVNPPSRGFRAQIEKITRIPAAAWPLTATEQRAAERAVKGA